MTKIILASGSPYRKKLLKKIVKQFEVKTFKINEKVFKKKIKEPKKLAKKLALEKAKNIKNQVKRSGKEKTLIIGADTLIALGKKIIGKAKDRKEAKEILLKLKGKTHKILTGIAVLEVETGKYRTAVEETKVTFREFRKKELEEFLDSEDWRGKAGAYGLQLRNFEFLEKYQGDYENILGLPLKKLVAILKEFGVLKGGRSETATNWRWDYH